MHYISSAYAASNYQSNAWYDNFRVGVQGYIGINSHVSGTAYSSNDNAFIGGGVLLGYQFNPYIAVEASYQIFRNESHRAWNDDFWGNFGPDHTKLYSYNLIGQFSYPLAHGFSLFANLGGAVVTQDVYNLYKVTDITPRVDTNTTKLYPVVGVGMNWQMFTHFGARISWMHIQGRGAVNSIDYFPLTLYITF